MDWFEGLEQRRSSILFAVSLIAVATLVVTALRIYAGFDVFWHLQMGKDWLENGASPWFDHFSFTYPGAEIIGPPVIFQFVVYKVVNVLGEFGGFFVIRLSAFLLVLSMMALWLRQVRAPVLTYCIVIPLLTVLLQLRGIVRPELFSYSLMILALMLYQRSRLELSGKSMLPIALLILFWTNYHSSILAYVIFFGLFVDIAHRLIRQRAPVSFWLAWAGWGSVMIGVGFLNPDLSHPLLQTLFFPAEWKELIQEYGSPTIFLGTPAIYVLILLTISTLLMLAKQQKIGFLAVSFVFVYAGLTMSRMVTPAGIVILCLLAHALSDVNWKVLQKRASPTIRALIAILSLVAFLVPLLNGVQKARSFMSENSEPFSKMPYDLTEHMLANNMSGNIFNAYEVGGYLIHRLQPDNQVYIDGRTGILYPLEHNLKYIEAMKSTEALWSEIEKYGIDFAVLKATPDYAALMEAVGFHLEFVDYQYALYTRNGGTFTHTGRFWANPSCWNSDISSAVNEEWPQALMILPHAVRVMPLLSAATKYDVSTDLDEFFRLAAMDEWLPDSTRRFLGYRALESNLFDYALDMFSNVGSKEAKDYLAGALAHLRSGRPADAERLLSDATRISWSKLDFESVLILHALLYEISQERIIELFDAQYLEELENSVGTHSLPLRGETVTVTAFCGDVAKS